MLLLCVIVIGYITICASSIVTESLVIIQPRNASTNIKNKLVCQKFTDIQPQIPILYAADHFSLPGNISSAINTFQLLFTVQRLRNDVDPDSITVVLMYDVPLTQSPGSIFFSKNVRAPGNPPLWRNETVGQVEVISLNITQGEMDGETRFDFANTTFLPREQRLWIGLYVIGERHFMAEPHAENVFFWFTTDQKAMAGERTPYFYRDESNLLNRGFRNWTNATMVESAFGLTSGEKHMAWSLTLSAVVPSTFIEMLQAIPTGELVLIIIAVLAGILCMCCCVICICKRCRVCCRRNLASLNTGKTASVPLYKLVPHNSNDNGASDTESQVSLEATYASASTMEKLQTPKSGRTPSSAYLDASSRIPVVVNGDLFDKHK